MKPIFIIILLSVFLQTIEAQNAPSQWILEKDSAAWKPRDSQGEVVYDGNMWIFGGYHSSYDSPPRDVWKSSDGVNWELVTKEAPWTHSDLPMSVTFKDKMWLMGGWYNGRLEDRSASNEVWSSSDGIQWDLVRDKAEWSPRCAAAIVEFKGKVWILGGTEDYYYEGESSLLNDVWYSDDGQSWQLATDQAPWPPRAYHQAVVLNDRMYVMGGGNYDPEYMGLNDVWSSSDGIHWREETSAAPWHDRIWFSSVVYKDHMWVIGGWSDNPYKNWPDAWYSNDGKVWNKLNTTGPSWKERHEQSAFVFKNKIWIAGGMTPPLVNDVWSLDWEPESKK